MKPTKRGRFDAALRDNRTVSFVAGVFGIVLREVLRYTHGTFLDAVEATGATTPELDVIRRIGRGGPLPALSATDRRLLKLMKTCEDSSCFYSPRKIPRGVRSLLARGLATQFQLPSVPRRAGRRPVWIVTRRPAHEITAAGRVALLGGVK